MLACEYCHCEVVEISGVIQEEEITVSNLVISPTTYGVQLYIKSSVRFIIFIIFNMPQEKGSVVANVFTQSMPLYIHNHSFNPCGGPEALSLITMFKHFYLLTG